MTRIGKRESALIDLCTKEGLLTKKMAVEKYGHWYYCNAEKHVQSDKDQLNLF